MNLNQFLRFKKIHRSKDNQIVKFVWMYIPKRTKWKPGYKEKFEKLNHCSSTYKRNHPDRCKFSDLLIDQKKIEDATKFCRCSKREKQSEQDDSIVISPNEYLNKNLFEIPIRIQNANEIVSCQVGGAIFYPIAQPLDKRDQNKKSDSYDSLVKKLESRQLKKHEEALSQISELKIKQTNNPKFHQRFQLIIDQIQKKC